MIRLSDAQLLMMWERGHGRPPYEQALVALAEAQPDMPLSQLAELPIGCRDQRLLKLRQQVFGSELATVTSCPQCNESLELEFQVADLLSLDMAANSTEHKVCLDGYAIRYRLPNSSDIASLGSCEAAERRTRLLERCVQSSHREETAVPIPQIPESVAEEVLQHMAKSDPLSDMAIDLSCPICNRSWMARFDVVSYFWTELSVWAQRLLAEVHALATAYSWSEREILALGPWRRQVYLNMVRQ